MSIPERSSPMSPVMIRRAVLEDAGLLAEMNRHVHDLHVAHRPDIYKEQRSPEDLTRIYEEQLGHESVRIFIAELPGGECAGYAIATVRQRAASTLLHAESLIFLNQLAVAPQATRRGVATALLNAVRDAGREAGCRRLITEVWDFNNEARAFYEAVGFLPTKHSLERPL
jgi:GNAT superfamily N-acetyltransferase